MATKERVCFWVELETGGVHLIDFSKPRSRFLENFVDEKYVIYGCPNRLEMVQNEAGNLAENKKKSGQF